MSKERGDLLNTWRSVLLYSANHCLACHVEVAHLIAAAAAAAAAAAPAAAASVIVIGLLSCKNQCIICDIVVMHFVTLSLDITIDLQSMTTHQPCALATSLGKLK